MTSLTWLQQGIGLVAKDEIERFMFDCLIKAGTPEDAANVLADNLVTADYRGQLGHGLSHLELYVKCIKTGAWNVHVKPEVLKQTTATAWVDGHNGLGVIIGRFCMKLAMEKAMDVGVGWVAAKNSNYYGMASYYSMMAMEKGLIGFTCSNAKPAMVPSRGKKAFFGTNPMSLAAPAKYRDSMVVDMATTTSSRGKMELRRRCQEWLAPGWARDQLGNETIDADEALRISCFTPLGGLEGDESAGHKGTGLAFMVEALSGLLAGAASGPDIPNWKELEEPANLGQCFMAVNPNCFAPHYDERVYDMLYRLRGQDPLDHKKKVMSPGDPEVAHMKKVDKAGGISYHSNQLKNAIALSDLLGVKPPSIR